MSVAAAAGTRRIGHAVAVLPRRGGSGVVERAVDVARRTGARLTVVVPMPLLHPGHWGLEAPPPEVLAAGVEEAVVEQVDAELAHTGLPWAVRVVTEGYGGVRRLVLDARADVLVLGLRPRSVIHLMDRRRLAGLARSTGALTVLV